MGFGGPSLNGSSLELELEQQFLLLQTLSVNAVNKTHFTKIGVSCENNDFCIIFTKLIDHAFNHKSSKIPSPIAYSRGGESSFPTPRDSLAKIESRGGGLF